MNKLFLNKTIAPTCLELYADQHRMDAGMDFLIKKIMVKEPFEGHLVLKMCGRCESFDLILEAFTYDEQFSSYVFELSQTIYIGQLVSYKITGPEHLKIFLIGDKIIQE